MPDDRTASVNPAIASDLTDMTRNDIPFDEDEEDDDEDARIALTPATLANISKNSGVQYDAKGNFRGIQDIQGKVVEEVNEFDNDRSSEGEGESESAEDPVINSKLTSVGTLVGSDNDDLFTEDEIATANSSKAHTRSGNATRPTKTCASTRDKEALREAYRKRGTPSPGDKPLKTAVRSKQQKLR
jgi:hypothetical protein